MRRYDADVENQLDGDTERTAERLREAIRQRRAELAADQEVTAGGGLPDLELVRVLEEPPNVSARPFFGPVITVWRRVVKRLALAWYLRPVLGQQNDFNQAAARRLADLVAEVERLERRLRVLESGSSRNGDP